MKNPIQSMTRKALPILLMLFAFSLSAQTAAEQDAAYQKAKQEIIQQFGLFPSFFDVYPKHALPSAWANFQAMSSPDSPIPPKYRELLQLAVASQIPCAYCIYYHSAAAKANGATDDEIQDAIAQGAQTRHWSMVLQGNQVSLEQFKREVDAALKYISEQAGG
jgi:AhpD family alkylhydroperoxidase